MKPNARSDYYRHLADDGSFISAGYNQLVLRDLYKYVPRHRLSWICDVGSGSGCNLPLIGALFSSSRLIAFDMNLMALTRGKRKTQSVFSVLSDVAAMPLRDGQMDLAVCTEVLEHVADLNLAVREIARVLRPGGYAIISSPNYLNPMGVRKLYKDCRHGREHWDPWGGHTGFERFMTPGLVGRAIAPFFEVLKVRGAGYVMAWIPLGYRRIGSINDRYPLAWLGLLPVIRDIAVNRFLLLRKKRQNG